MDTIIPLVQFTFDETDPKAGMAAISLVDQPAIESNFHIFSNDIVEIKYFKSEGVEGRVEGLVLIPDKLILRKDKQGNPYYGYFTAETIEKLRDKFHKELKTNNVSTDHNGKAIDAYLTESFIIKDEHQLASVKARGKGIPNATIGSWFVQEKVEDDKTIQRVLSGELNGFSVEAFLDTFVKVNNNSNKVETKMNKWIEKFEQFLNEIKADTTAPVVAAAEEKPASGSTAPASGATPSTEPKKLEVAKIYDGTDSVEWGEIGAPVNIILVDGNKKLAGEGSYITDTQKELVVDAAGNLVEVKSIQKEITEDKPELAMIPVAQANANVQAEAAKFSKIVEDANLEKVALAKEIEALKAEVAILKKAPLAEPVIVTKEKAEFSKTEFSKLSNTEQIALKNGFTLPKSVSKK